MSAQTHQPRIAIVGGGPAGLTMGVLLQKHKIPFTIFEFRPKPTEEDLAKVSGMLDLHEGDGLTAIRECGLYDQFLPLTGECTEEYILCDMAGTRMTVDTGAEKSRPEISRNNLTKLLLSKVPDENVRWDHKLLSATQDPQTGVTELDFGNGRKHEFDFVVGADGAWSKVRGLVSDVKPYYTNTQIITTTIVNITTKYPHLAKLVGTGSFTALGNKHAAVSQRGPQDSCRAYFWITVADEHYGATTGLASKTPREATATLLEDNVIMGDYGALIKELVSTALEEETVSNPGTMLDIRPLYALPYGFSWQHKPGVSVIGDAAHVMLPNGEGVNQAMLDATQLSKAIAQAYGEAGTNAVAFSKALSPLVEQFEKGMTERAVGVGQQTEMVMKMWFSENAAQEMKAFFESHMGPAKEEVEGKKE